MGKQVSLEFSDKAHESIRAAVSRYGVPQKYLLNALLENWDVAVNDVYLAPIMAELKAGLPKRKQTANSLAKMAVKLPPEERDKLRRALDGA